VISSGRLRSYPDRYPASGLPHDIDHIADQVAEVRGDGGVAADDLLDGHRIGDNIGTSDGLLDIVGVERRPAGCTEARSRANELD